MKSWGMKNLFKGTNTLKEMGDGCVYAYGGCIWKRCGLWFYCFLKAEVTNFCSIKTVFRVLLLMLFPFPFLIRTCIYKKFWYLFFSFLFLGVNLRFYIIFINKKLQTTFHSTYRMAAFENQHHSQIGPISTNRSWTKRMTWCTV